MPSTGISLARVSRVPDMRLLVGVPDMSLVSKESIVCPMSKVPDVESSSGLITYDVLYRNSSLVLVSSLYYIYIYTHTNKIGYLIWNIVQVTKGIGHAVERVIVTIPDPLDSVSIVVVVVVL